MSHHTNTQKYIAQYAHHFTVVLTAIFRAIKLTASNIHSYSFTYFLLLTMKGKLQKNKRMLYTVLFFVYMNLLYFYRFHSVQLPIHVVLKNKCFTFGVDTICNGLADKCHGIFIDIICYLGKRVSENAFCNILFLFFLKK